MTNSTNINVYASKVVDIRGRFYLRDLSFVQKRDAELFLDFIARKQISDAAPQEKLRRIAIAESFSPILHTNWRKTVGFFIRDGVIHPLTVLKASTICSIVRGIHDSEMIGDFAVQLYVLAAEKLDFVPDEWNTSVPDHAEFIEEVFAEMVRDILPDFRKKYRQANPELKPETVQSECSRLLLVEPSASKSRSGDAQQRQRWGTIHGKTIRAVIELLNGYPSEWCGDFAPIAKEASNRRRRALGTGGKNILPETAERVGIRARSISLSASDAARFSDADLELLFRYLKKAVSPQQIEAGIAA